VGVVVAIAAAAVWWFAAARRSTGPADRARADRADPIRVEGGRIAVPAAPAPTLAPVASGAAAAPPEAPPVDVQLPEKLGLGAVDLDEVRKAMPNNLYWKLSAPTNDPQVLEEREAQRAQWNVEYGKILSGTASEEEIRAYYDRRAQLSGDYIEFATYLLDHYKDDLSEQDLTLVHLALQLNRARLEEIPRKIETAFERKRKQDAARAAWLADQAAFGAADADSK
jgi:hypothetical protein